MSCVNGEDNAVHGYRSHVDLMYPWTMHRTACAWPGMSMWIRSDSFLRVRAPRWSACSRVSGSGCACRAVTGVVAGRVFF